MVQGLRQAFIMVVLSLLVGAALAGLWVAFRGGGFLLTTGVVLLALAALWGATSTSDSTRAGMTDVRAFLGQGPEGARPDGTSVLTGLAVLLFVSLPLAAAGFVLLATGA